MNNVRNGESKCDGGRHDASRSGGSILVHHFGGSAVVVGGVVGPYYHMVGSSSDFVSFDSPSGRLQRVISSTRSVHMNT